MGELGLAGRVVAKVVGVGVGCAFFIFVLGMFVGAPLARQAALAWLSSDPQLKTQATLTALQELRLQLEWATFDASVPRIIVAAGLLLLLCAVGAAVWFLFGLAYRAFVKPEVLPNGQVLVRNPLKGQITIIDPERAPSAVTVLTDRGTRYDIPEDRDHADTALRLGTTIQNTRALTMGSRNTVSIRGDQPPKLAAPQGIAADVPPPLPPKQQLPELITMGDLAGPEAPYLLVLGLSERGTEYLNLRKPTAAHILIGGTTGGGKTNLLKSFLLQMAPWIDTRITVIDPDSVMTRIVKTMANAQLMDEVEEWEQFFSASVAELNLRRNVWKENSIENWDDVNHQEYPLEVILVDELRVVTQSPVSLQHLTTLVTRGRKFGFHVIGATQHPNPDVVPREVSMNFPVRICFKVPQRYESETILGRKGAELLPDYPGRVLATVSTPPIPVQTPKVGSAPVQVSSPLDDLDKKIKAALQPGEVGLTQLRSQFSRKLWEGLGKERLYKLVELGEVVKSESNTGGRPTTTYKLP